MEMAALTLSVLGLLVTAAALWVTVSSFRKQLRLSFFADYTKRYQELMLNLPASVYAEDFSFESLKEPEQEQALRYMRAYFDLCSEEHHLRQEGHVDDNTWREWKAGMRYAFSRPAFKECWQAVQDSSHYFPEFSQFIAQLGDDS